MTEQHARGETAQTTGQDLLTGQWDHLRRQVRSWWDRLTEADLTQIAGKREQLISLIQERYGYPWERAEQEVDRRLREYRETAEGVAATVTTTVRGAASRVGETAGAYVAEVQGDLVGLIRRYPIPTLLIGLGVGFLLGSSLGAAKRTSWTGGEGDRSPDPSEAGYPEAMIQCTRCGQMVRQADIVEHSTVCSGTDQPGYGGAPT